MAHSLADLHTGALTQAQLIGVGIINITGQAAAHIVEEDVAAPLDGRDHIDVAAVAMAGAAGAVPFIKGVHAVAEHRGVLVDEPGIQRSHGHGRLEGGAGGVQALQRPVEQGQTLVRAVLAVLGGIQVLVKAGIIGCGQHAAVLHIQHHGGTGGGFHAAGVVDPVDHVDVLGQCLVHRFLEPAVDGQLDGVARLGHSGQGRIHNDPIGVAGDGLHAILAPQFFLVSRFQARDADDVVHVVAFFAQGVGGLAVFIGHLPLFSGDLAHPAQHMGQHRGLLIAAGTRFHDLHARQRKAVLLDGRHGGLADVFRHDKVVHIGKRLQLHLVMDAAQRALPAQRIAGKVVVLHQLLHHIIGRCVLL